MSFSEGFKGHPSKETPLGQGGKKKAPEEAAAPVPAAEERGGRVWDMGRKGFRVEGLGLGFRV